MRKLLGALMVLGLLAAQGPVMADLWGDGDWDTGLWDSDNWGDDDYGYYDNDFDWTTDDGAFENWYGDADDDWNTVYENEYGIYDDQGDEGWFDV